MNSGRNKNLFVGVDSLTVLLYILIVVAGCLCITSSSYDSSTVNAFSFSHFYIKQLIWCFGAFVAALLVLLVDVSIFHKYSYMFYGLGIILLLMTLVFGREVNGAKAWFELGPIRMQPVEIVKISTALATARIMSEYSFSINRPKDMLNVALILLIPLAIIIMQNDTGSGIVLGSFIFVLYREGLNKWLCIPILLIATLFIVSFIFSPLLILIVSIVVLVVCDMMIHQEWRLHSIYLASIMMATILLFLLSTLVMEEPMTIFSSLLWVTLLSIPLVVVYAFRQQLVNTFILLGLFALTMLFLPATDYIFNSILRQHQQNRILTFLGIMSDPLGTGYNVNQSKIAIGSGGWFGKGFLQGTQIKYGFVPERHTDFIFCSLGEEWGFVGAVVVLILFCALILRLLHMGERQDEPFARIYCYCVASIFLFHILVNVGMTIGLMPVMGIPLPFMSYGGSSLVAFTTLLFIAIKLDSNSHRDQIRYD